jgi:hypothetical protein
MNAISVGWDQPRAYLRFVRLLAVVMLVLLTIGSFGSARAAEPSALQGDYVGGMNGRLMRLHISVASDGKLRCRFDDQAGGKVGMPCTDLKLEGDSVSFSVPVLRGSWKGSIQNGGAMLSGTWAGLGQPLPLTFTR